LLLFVCSKQLWPTEKKTTYLFTENWTENYFSLLLSVLIRVRILFYFCLWDIFPFSFIIKINFTHIYLMYQLTAGISVRYIDVQGTNRWIDFLLFVSCREREKL
jgi:hypothetical protein